MVTKIAKSVDFLEDLKSERKYLNFPITLMRGMMDNKEETLANIFHYGVFRFSQSIDFVDDEDLAYEKAFEYFGGYKHSIPEDIERGSILFDSLPEGVPFTGLSAAVFWDYLEKDKSEFELVSLLAYLAAVSILGKSLLWKTNMQFFVSRMDGYDKAFETERITPALHKYLSRYHADKLKDSLAEKWHIQSYGYRIRGFYMSKALPLKSLIREVEKNRETRRRKQRVQTASQLRKEVINELENSHSVLH